MASLESFKGVIEPKLYQILKLFLGHQERLYHLQSIAQETKVPLATTFRLVRKLVRADYVTVIHVGKMKLYKLREGVQL